MVNRPDDPISVMKHSNLYKGGTALIVLGGTSGNMWQELYAQVQPDALLGGNGVVLEIDSLDYWMCAENMTLTNNQSVLGNADALRKMGMFQCSTPRWRFLSHRSWNLVCSKQNVVCIRRKGWEEKEMPHDYTFREYGEGFHSGWLLKHAFAGAAVHVGTVALHLLHLACILGVSEVHTIGLDLCFKDENRHHWYDYPIYEVDRFRKDAMFTDYQGLETQWVWIECAECLQWLDPYFQRDGMIWHDHSEGLLSEMGARCTK